MLDLLTLRITNVEVSKNFENHQAKKLDRLLWGGIVANAVYLLNACLNAFAFKNGPLITVLCDALMFILVVSFKVFRSRFRRNTKFHEYIVVAIFAIPVILCSLVNTDCLPKGLLGPGIDDFRPNYTG
jgi:hypothetical protein